MAHFEKTISPNDGELTSPPLRRRWLFARLTIQNLGKRPARTVILVAAVAVSVGTLLSTLVLAQAAQKSMGVGFARMGADLLIVPRETLVNLTPALLTIEPTPHTLPASAAAEVTQLAGVEQVAPQRHFAIAQAESGHVREIDVIAFDPANDFTVVPWLKEKLPRELQEGDAIIGGRRGEPVGNTVSLGGQSLTVYGRLGLTGVGPFDRSVFVSFPTAKQVMASRSNDKAPSVDLPSALLVRLAIGSRVEEIRLALADRPDLKIVAGNPLFTSVRHSLAAVLGSLTLLVVFTVLGTGLMTCSLYSAIISERKRELGLLLALGMRVNRLTRLVAAEAMLTTALGGLCGLLLGAALLLIVRRSLVYSLEWMDVPFLWPAGLQLATDVGACLALAPIIGLMGVIVPCWQALRQDPYELIRAEGN